MDKLLPIHIAAGALGLLSGYIALYSAKGAALHRRSGMLFVCAMLTMCAGGLVLAVGRSWAEVNIPAALMTSYLVVTSLTTVRPPAAGARALGIGAMLLAVTVGAVQLTRGIEALASGGSRNGVPAFPFLLFGCVGLIAGAGDVRMMRSGPLQGARRLARHLWRMSFALFIAAMSFFFGQAKVIPKPLRIMPLLALPVLAVLVTMLYWLWRVRVRPAPSPAIGAMPSRMAAFRALRWVPFVLILTGVVAGGAGPDAPSNPYKAKRTENGQPDLQGMWNFSSDIPLERPASVVDRKTFTRQEVEARRAAKASAFDVIAKAAPVLAVGLTWLDYTGQIEDLRTSLITYPENGKLPALIEGVRRAPGPDEILGTLADSRDGPPPALLLAILAGGKRDGPEDLSLSERCLYTGATPFVPGFDSNYLQIVQAQDHVVLLTEDQRKIVPLDGRPHVSGKLRSWYGDSRGRWEGESLVIETTNFNNRTRSFAGAGNALDKVVTERLTRIAPNVLRYEATIVDPKTFQDKVVISMPMPRVNVRIYENACHEGNYSMSGMLSAARAEERDAK